MTNHLFFTAFVVPVIIAALAILNFADDRAGHISKPDPRFHDNKMQAGGLDVSAE